MNLKHEQIIGVFEDLEVLKQDGIWFSGIRDKGKLIIYKLYRNGGVVKENEFKT